MADWPATLPTRPLVDGYSASIANNILASEMDVGPAKLRRRTTTNVTPIKVQYRLTATQLAAFQYHYLIDQRSGTLPFNFPHPETGSVVTARYDPKSLPSWSALQGTTDVRLTIAMELLI